jgi:hypothetical protein
VVGALAREMVSSGGLRQGAHSITHSMKTRAASALIALP